MKQLIKYIFNWLGRFFAIGDEEDPGPYNKDDQ